MSTSRKIIVGILIAVIVLILTGGTFVYVMLSRINYVSVDEASARAQEEVIGEPAELPDASYDPNTTDAPLPEVAQTELSEAEKAKLADEAKRANVKNVLLIGVDRRSSSGGSRSDTMLIATLDGNNKRLKLTSVMRDMYLDIPGMGPNRINTANVSGGPGLLMQTINENFALDLQNYVLVDFRMFAKIVDMVGGVTIHMSEGEVAEANDCIAGLNKQWGRELTSNFITKRGGNVKLNGTQALGYSRIRHFGNGDYARTSRQFKVLNAIFKKFAALNPLKQTEVLYSVLPYIETNLEKTEILDLALSALGTGVTDLMHYRMPVDGYYKSASIKGMSVLVPDIPGNAQLLHDFIYDATEVAPLPGSNTESGTYHPKTTPLLDEFGNPIDPNATPTPDPFATPAVLPTPTPTLTPPGETPPPVEGLTPTPTLTATPAL